MKNADQTEATYETKCTTFIAVSDSAQALFENSRSQGRNIGSGVAFKIMTSKDDHAIGTQCVAFPCIVRFCSSLNSGRVVTEQPGASGCLADDHEIGGVDGCRFAP
jgi:hypothetical protein